METAPSASPARPIPGFNLLGKRVFVTGGSRGIGRASALTLAAAGADVAVGCSPAGNDAADKVCAEIRELGRRAAFYAFDVSMRGEVQTMCDRVQNDFDGIDILVNNAGVTRDRLFRKMDRDTWDTVINTNLNSVFDITQRFIEGMAGRGWGRVINVSSIVGRIGNFGQTNYAAAKAGIVGMVRTWALELERAGITANAVVPVAATAMTATVPYFAAAVGAEARGEPMPAFFRHDLGFGTAGDVAGLIAFLGSDAAATVTGQVIGVGGDRLQIWTHPEAALTAYREGGWGYDALLEAWPAEFAEAAQSVGERFPELPDEFTSAVS
jgi:3-oxoacyl-[acyl-carrier protein] reductase